MHIGTLNLIKYIVRTYTMSPKIYKLVHMAEDNFLFCLLHKALIEVTFCTTNIKCSTPHNMGIKTLSKKT